MTDYAYPAGELYLPAQMSWRIRANVVISTAAHNGAIQTVEAPGARWLAMLHYTPHKVEDRAGVEAYWAKVRGQVNRVTMHHLMRPAPRGTMRGAPVLASTAAFGAQALAITTTAGASVFAGDMLKVGGQLVMVIDDAAANGSGALSVNISPPLRASVAGGQAVTWDKPTARFISTSNEIEIPYGPKIAPPFSVELMEVF